MKISQICMSKRFMKFLPKPNHPQTHPDSVNYFNHEHKIDKDGSIRIDSCKTKRRLQEPLELLERSDGYDLGCEAGNNEEDTNQG
jgi:hypothetical protein